MQVAFLMEIGTGDVVEFFQPDNIEQVVSVSNLPRIELSREPLVVFPEIEGRIVARVVPDIRMAGH